MPRKRAKPTIERIHQILKELPTGDWWRETDEGEIVPSLDLYLHIADALGASISITFDRVEENRYRATATLTYDNRVISRIAEATLSVTEDESTQLAHLETRALIRAFRVAWGHCINAWLNPDNARNHLLMLAHVAFKNYPRRERLALAASLLNKNINSFTELTNAELAELICERFSEQPVSSQYADP